MNPEITPFSPDGIDVQASRPATRVSLSRVGVTGVEKVLSIGEDGHFHAEMECYVDLSPDQAGVTCPASRRTSPKRSTKRPL